MPTSVEQIEAQAMQLSSEERADLAERLWMSVDLQKEPVALSPEWEAEIARRVAEFEAGEVQPIPAEEVFARLDEQLEQHRRASK